MVAFHQDVLESVCGVLDNYRDLRSFSLTCSALRPAAIRCLLRLKPVVLTEDTIHAFHRFVFSDLDGNALAHAQHIRGIDIAAHESLHPQQFSDDIARCFVEIIESAIHLEHLTLRNFCDPHLGDTRIIPIINRLPSLVHLCLEKCGTSDDFLQATLSPVRILQVGSSALSPFDSMAHMAPTLESIELWSICFSEFSAVGPQFPAVHSVVAEHSLGTPHLDALLHMFPFLGALSLPYFNFFVDGPSTDAIREANKHAQDTLGEHSWKTLDHVHCFPVLLYVLNLQCSVRHLALNCLDGRLQPQLTSAALRRARPTYLELLDINVANPEEMRDLSDRDLFPSEVRTTITHLLLLMKYRDPQNSDSTGTAGESSESTPLWKTVVDTLCSAIQALNGLIHLHIIIHCHSSPKPENTEVEFVQTLFHGGPLLYRLATEELVAAAPSLQNIIYTIKRSPPYVFSQDYAPADHWHLESGWRVTRHGVSRSMDEVDTGSDWHPEVEELSSEQTKSVRRRGGFD